VRTALELAQVDGLIIPGGESTTIARLMDAYELRAPLVAHAQAGKPVWGTCAGMILMADRLVEDRPQPLGLMELLVHRNAFGRQVDSFEADVAVEELAGGPFRAVFIRAPVVREAGPRVRVLARLRDGRMVAVRQAHLLGTAFHPELTDDLRFHRYFVNMVVEARAAI
jgi:5'-phosphate synthase pdxT subunit